MKKTENFVTLLQVSTARIPSDLTITELSSRIPIGSPRILKNCYVKVGRLTIPRDTKYRLSQAEQVRMLRTILIALLICHRCCRLQLSDRLYFSQKIRLSAIRKKIVRRFESASITQILRSTEWTKAQAQLLCLNFPNKYSINTSTSFLSLLTFLLKIEYLCIAKVTGRGSSQVMKAVYRSLLLQG